MTQNGCFSSSHYAHLLGSRKKDNQMVSRSFRHHYLLTVIDLNLLSWSWPAEREIGKYSPYSQFQDWEQEFKLRSDMYFIFLILILTSSEIDAIIISTWQMKKFRPRTSILLKSDVGLGFKPRRLLTLNSMIFLSLHNAMTPAEDRRENPLFNKVSSWQRYSN